MLLDLSPEKDAQGKRAARGVAIDMGRIVILISGDSVSPIAAMRRAGTAGEEESHDAAIRVATTASEKKAMESFLWQVSTY
jgi:hypothetical protein